MPQLNRIQTIDRQYPTHFQSKGSDTSVNAYPLNTKVQLEFNVAETFPNCYSIEQDCAWFLGVGVIPQELPICQFGQQLTTLGALDRNIKVIFPGIVTYKVRPGKISRDPFNCWSEERVNIFLPVP